ncbi:MAG: DUF4405 domain-containing protein [Candidatus Bathyarchaeia archaeon]
MEKSKINYIVDVLMVLSFFVVAVTGLVLFLFLNGRGRFFGSIRHAYVSIHNWSGMIFIILVIIHLILHWDWIVCMTKNVFIKKGSNKIQHNKCP